MSGKQVLKYASNCFILIIPILLWNILFMISLPKKYSMAVFWQDIPPIIGTTENILRLIVFALPLLMPLTIKSTGRKIGLGVYLAGMAIYFLSWMMQFYYPASTWSRSLFGFLAPAYTTIIWFIGIGLIGNKVFVKIPYKPTIYIAISTAFVFIHTMHAYIVYMRL